MGYTKFPSPGGSISSLDLIAHLASDMDTYVVDPDDDGAGIQDAVDAVVLAGGGRILLRPGIYSITDEIIKQSSVSSLFIQGFGEDTVLEVDTTSGFSNGCVFNFDPSIHIGNCNNTTAGSSTLTFTTASDAANVAIGDAITLHGTDANSERDAEVVFAAAAGNGGTGQVTLRFPLLRTMTSVNAEILHLQRNIIMDNFTIRRTAGTNDVVAVSLRHCQDSLAHRLWIDKFTATGDVGISFYGANQVNIEKCRITECNSYGIDALYTFNSKLIGNYLQECGLDASSPAVFLNQLTTDAIVERNEIYNCGSHAIDLSSTSSNGCRRVDVIRNTISRAGDHGIRLSLALDCNLTDNKIDRAIGNYCITLDDVSKRISVSGGSLMNSKRGLNFGNAIESRANGIGIAHMANQGIVVQGSSGQNSIVGCNFKNTTDPAVAVSSSQKVSIIGCTSNGCGADAFSLAAAERCQLIGNYTQSSTGDGIKLDNSSNNNIVGGNNCLDGITQGSGTGNQFFNNNDA